jgi:hypothetical protein
VSPTNNVFVGTLVTFTASVSGAQPLHFQWQFNSGGGYTNIAGANTNTLVLNAAITNTGSYELVLTNSYGAVTSAPVTLTVTLDTNPRPFCAAINRGTTNVELDFSKMVEPASATNLANYVFTNGLAITAQPDLQQHVGPAHHRAAGLRQQLHARHQWRSRSKPPAQYDCHQHAGSPPSSAPPIAIAIQRRAPNPATCIRAPTKITGGAGNGG